MTPTVTDSPAESRFEIRDDEGTLAGLAEYHLYRGTIALTHTEIKPAFEGQGLAGTLVRHTLDDARSRGRTVEPFCPFVRGYIGKHPEYRDLVREDEWERFGLA